MLQCKQYRRRGSMYVAVLGCAMIVAVIGLSALTMTRIERSFADGTADFAQARLYAQSAVEMGLLRIKNNPDWRTTYPSGVWETSQPIGTGTYTLEGVDPNDNNLKDLDTDPVVLTGIGDEGDARYKLEVTLAADVDPLSCLEVSLQTGNDLVFDASVGPITANGDQILAANDMMMKIVPAENPPEVLVYPDMEAVNGFSGELGPGTMTPGVPLREMPVEATVFDYYEDGANGTLIDSLNLPGDASTRRLEGVVLSPNSNPYGPTDPNGVYRIDCRGSQLLIENCRIVGTLVIVNGGSTSLVAGSVNWEPVVQNYPALLMRGTMSWWQKADPLDEATNGVNFNPVGTPYLGSEDDLLDDQYPSMIKGLVYVSNDLNATSFDFNMTIHGVLIVGNTFTVRPSGALAHTLDLTYDQRYYDNPPPGFRTPPRMLISQGTWRQVVD